MTHPIRSLFLVGLTLALGAQAAPDSPGCRAAKEFVPLARVYAELQGDFSALIP